MMEESCIEPYGAMLAVMSFSSAQPEAKAHQEGRCWVLLLSPLPLLVLLLLQLLVLLLLLLLLLLRLLTPFDCM